MDTLWLKAPRVHQFRPTLNESTIRRGKQQPKTTKKAKFVLVFFLENRQKNLFRCSEVGKISKIPLACIFLLNKKLVIRPISANARFSASFTFAKKRFYCTLFLWKHFQNDGRLIKLALSENNHQLALVHNWINVLILKQIVVSFKLGV